MEGQPVAVGFQKQPFQQYSGNPLHVTDVLTALAIHIADRIAQDIYHHPPDLFFVTALFRKKRQHASLFQIQSYGVPDSSFHNLGIKRTADIIRNTEIKGAAYVRVRVVCRNHYNGDIIQPMLPIHFVKHIKSVHSGHNNIQQHNGDLRSVPFQELQSFFAAVRFQNIEALAENSA